MGYVGCPCLASLACALRGLWHSIRKLIGCSMDELANGKHSPRKQAISGAEKTKSNQAAKLFQLTSASASVCECVCEFECVCAESVAYLA